MVYVNHKCFFNQMMAISHPFTSCINWNELGTLMERVCIMPYVKDVYLFSMKVRYNGFHKQLYHHLYYRSKLSILKLKIENPRYIKQL